MEQSLRVHDKAIKKAATHMSMCKPSDSVDGPIIKQGFIKKWTNYVGGYRKRFFVFTGEVLTYYQDEKLSVQEKGSIHMRLAKIDP